MRYMAVLAGVLGAAAVCVAGGGLQVAPPADVPATLPAGPGGDAVRKLVAAAGLKLSLEKDAKPDQYLVRGTLHPAATPQIHPNALTYFFGRDRDKAVFMLYASESGLPLIYATTEYSVLVSTTAPGKLELHTGLPMVLLNGATEKKSFNFGFGLGDKAKFDVNMQSFIESLSLSVRSATLTDGTIGLELLSTRAEIELPAKAGDFPIRAVRIFPQEKDVKEPLFSAEFSLTAPGPEFFKTTQDGVRKLKVDEVKEVGNLLRPLTVIELGGYVLGDLGKDGKMTAAARELATIVPAIPDSKAALEKKP